MRQRAWLLAPLLALSLTGCLTIQQAVEKHGPAVFGGTRAWAKLLTTGACGPPVGIILLYLPPLWAPVLVLILPDVALDALLLPASIPNEIVAGGITVRRP